MLINYLKSAVRNLLKTRLFSFINILGLALGMASSLLILHYVQFERSYDRFYPDFERIYRLRYERTTDTGKTVKFASCTPPAAPAIRQSLPEVEAIGRVFKHRASVAIGETKFYSERMFYAEPDFLDILRIKFIHGGFKEDFSGPGKALISRSAAKKYFNGQGMEKHFSVDKKEDYRVVGIFEDIPENSHLKFDILLSFKNLETLYGPDIMNSWGHTMFYTYLRLRPGVDLKSFDSKLNQVVGEACGPLLKKYKIEIHLKMQPLKEIHLTSRFMQEYEANGNRNSVRFLFLIALLIIVIAWVNYINLSTARSLARSREVGMRKVVGASRIHLMVQFFMETVMVNFMAMVIAAAMISIAFPLFCRITGVPPHHTLWSQPWFWAVAGMMLLGGILLSGIYPVMVMSGFRPVQVLRGKLGNSPQGMNFRKVLVVFQFVMAVGLITGTLAIFMQLNHLKQQDLGINIQQTLVIKGPRVKDKSYPQKVETFKNTLKNHGTIHKICLATEVPGRQLLWDAGGIRPKGQDFSKGKNYQIVGVDYDFLNVFQLQMVAGRYFSKDFPADKMALIFNETAVKWMGFSSPQEAVGKEVDYWGKFYKIIGVLPDYHQQSPKESYEPNIYRLMPYGRGPWGIFAIKVDTPGMKKTISFIKEKFDHFFPGNPFDYFFLEDYYAQQYQSDEMLGRIVGVFALLAILVTCLGILGLSSFMTLQRTKEIGIRKVLGAPVGRITLLLTEDFLKLLILAFVIAFPFTWWAIHEWLNTFVVRMSITPWLFLLPPLIISLITLLTMATHVLKASLSNPVHSLKYE